MEQILLTPALAVQEKIQNGLSTRAIANKYNTSERTVRRKLSKANAILNKTSSYDENSNEFSVKVKSTGKDLKLPFDTHKKIKQSYSNWDGKPSNFDQISKEVGIPKKTLQSYVKANGWNHEIDPFVEEELVSKEEEDLINELLEEKKIKAFKKLESQREIIIKKAAEKWFHAEHSIKQTIDDLLAQHISYSVPKLNINEAYEKYAIVLAPADLHYGKGSWKDETGFSYTRAQTSILLKKHTSKALSRVTRHGRPEKIYMPIGNDWFHIDNPRGQTTGGTKQDLDGTPALILKEAMELAVEHIDIVRQVAPVELVLCYGNHDEYTSIALMMFLHAWYRNCPDVTVELTLRPRNYTYYGNTLLAFSHGSETTPTKITTLIPHEARNLWGQLKYTALFTGHLHFEQSNDINGVNWFQCPSLSAADIWHSKQGYVASRRALSIYLIYFEEGPCGQISSSVNESIDYGFKLPRGNR